MFDLDRSYVWLSVAAIRVIWPVIVIASLMTFAALLIMNYPSGGTGAAFGGFFLAMVIMIGAATLIGLTVYRSMLCAEGTPGWAALRSTPASWAVTYFGVTMVVSIAHLVVIMLVAIALVLAGLSDPESLDTDLGLEIANSVVFILSSILLGLMFPDIAVSGRVRLGMALRMGLGQFRRLAVALCLPFFVIFIPSSVLSYLINRDMIFTAMFETGIAASPVDLGLTVVTIVLDGLGVAVVSVVLAKVYADIDRDGLVVGAASLPELFD